MNPESSKKNRPASPEARRVAAIMHRRLTTAWDPKKEIQPFRKLIKAGVFENLDDLTILERYYAEHWPPNRDKNILRHDLPTLLNNFQGELDRATAYCESHPIRKERKIIPIVIQGTAPKPLTDPAEIAAHERFINELRARKGKPLLGDQPEAEEESRSD